MPVGSSIEKLSQKADFVFDGTVKEVTGKTASVTIGAVHNGTEVLRGFEGQDIAVKLSGGLKLKAGQNATFFTNPTVFGDTLEVQSLAQRPQGRAHAGASLGADQRRLRARRAAVGDPVAERNVRAVACRFVQRQFQHLGRMGRHHRPDNLTRRSMILCAIG